MSLRKWRVGRVAQLAVILGAVGLVDLACDTFAIAGDEANAAENRTAVIDPSASGKPPVVPVVRVRPSQMAQLRIVPIELATISLKRPALGQIAFNEDASTVILSPLSGRATRLIARIGDRIERGAPLFEIDSPEVVQTQTDLIAAAQGLGKARSQLALAQRTLARMTELAASRATSMRELDQAKGDAAAAESDVKTAEGALLAARNKLRVLVGRSEAEIQRVERDRVINPLFTVTSPIGGTIVSRKIGPGQYVRSDSSEPLLTISDLSTMWLKANVPESDIPYVRVGQEIEVQVPALQNRVFTAGVSAIGAASDSATRRVVVRSELPNPDGLLRAEMFASFRITIGNTAPTPVVPLEALIREGGLAFVWVEREPNVFERRPVQIGIENGNRVQVLSGVKAGEKVVGRGAIFVDNEWR